MKRAVKPEHEVAYQDLCALMNKHAASLSKVEMLAIAANMLGKIVAMQDQREVSPAYALEIIRENLQLGNRQVIEELAKTAGQTIQ